MPPNREESNRSHRKEEGNSTSGNTNAPDSGDTSYTHPDPPQSGPPDAPGGQSAPRPDREES